MQMIADAVNLGKPTLYHYFRSKSEILFAMHKELVAELLEAHNARAMKTSRPDDLLEGLCLDTITFITEHPGYVRAFFEHYHDLNEAQQKEVKEQRRNYLKMVTDIIQSGIDKKLFVKCDPRTAALGFLGMCNWTYQWLPKDKSTNVKAVATDLSKLFLKGIVK